MSWFRASVLVLLAAGVFVALSLRLGTTPAVGPFLNPFAGFWQNGTGGEALPEAFDVPGLQAPVEVVWDERHVPHIFAANDHDLYFAQGYLTARHRLWQMEFQTHAAAGRLSEFLGSVAVEHDRSRRRIGMLYAAERSVAAMRDDPVAWGPVEAYVEGVNAWIDQLDAADLPLEYKILGYEPEAWTPLKTALLLKYMSWTLTGRNNEAAMTEARQVLGDSVMARLFPYTEPFLDPIIPPATAWTFEAAATPPVPPSFDGRVPTTSQASPTPPDPTAGGPHIGSNNWAVAGTKTVTGRPLLANDPHLSLSLPSIWYEIQLSAPSVNVYGATLPGAPGVIIGFNADVAWGVTNAGSDVMDWYEIAFEDDTYQRYRYDGGWRATEPRVEVVEVRGAEAIVDTVYYTHHGPVAYRPGEDGYGGFPIGAALRWAAHDPASEIRTFLGLNRATSYDDYVEALTYYGTPAQNFVFAAGDGTIGLWHNGQFPLRWPGQGRYLSDGADPAYDWSGSVPHAQVPHVRDPARGFVSSANQKPVSDDYPYYLGWDYAPFERGVRINERLETLQNATPRDMMALQLDSEYLLARTVLPRLLDLTTGAGDLTADEQTALARLAAWNYQYEAEQPEPILFDRWWRRFEDAVWQDDLGTALEPSGPVLADLLLEEPSSRFFDDAETPQTETPAMLAAATFREAYADLADEFGPMGSAWAWGRTRRTDIGHLGRIPGLGRTDLPTSGRPATVNATGSTYGPSWRMVVSLEDSVRAWGIYPGGQSGAPGSAYYDSMVDDWVAGRMYPLLFLPTSDADAAGLVARTTLR